MHGRPGAGVNELLKVPSTDWRTSSLPPRFIRASRVVQEQRQSMTPRSYAKLRASTPAMQPVDVAGAQRAVTSFLLRAPSRQDTFRLEEAVVRRAALEVDVRGEAPPLAKDLMRLMQVGAIPAVNHAKIFSAMPSGVDGFRALKELATTEADASETHTLRALDQTLECVAMMRPDEPHHRRAHRRVVRTESQSERVRMPRGTSSIERLLETAGSASVAGRAPGEYQPMPLADRIRAEGDMREEAPEYAFIDLLGTPFDVIEDLQSSPPCFSNLSTPHVSRELQPARRIAPQGAGQAKRTRMSHRQEELALPRLARDATPSPKPTAYQLYRQRLDEAAHQKTLLDAACKSVHLPVARGFTDGD